MLQKSLRPRPRPQGLKTAAKPKVQSEGETPGNVQTIATTQIELPGAQPLLLGIFGKQGAPHALIRLPSGEVRNVAKGDRIGGQTVAAIAEDAVILGNSRRLRMP